MSDRELDGATPDAKLISEAIRDGWINRGFKMGIGFFLAGLLIWLIPILLLTTCVGGLAAIGAAAGVDEETATAAPIESTTVP